MARKKNVIAPDRDENSMALDKMSAEIEKARELYGDGQPFEEERVLDCIVFRAERTTHEMYELGKYCLWYKAEVGHGRFLEGLRSKDLNICAADWAMLMVEKFGAKFDTVSNLGVRKARLLTTFTKEEIDEYAKGGSLKGIPHDDVERKTYSELAGTVRELHRKVDSQKERYEKTLKNMTEELSDLRMRYANQQPPTKEQTAKAELLKLARPYTFALAKVNASVREAYALVKEAEKVPGADVLMLNGWFNQFSPEMTTFAELHQAWTDEVDEAHPIEVGKIALEPDEGKTIPGSWSVPGSLDVPELG
jgi:hypothetical protein